MVLAPWAGVSTAPSFPESPPVVARTSSEGGRYADVEFSAAFADQADVPSVDSARAEFEVGRYWHASRMLRDLRTGGAVLTPTEVLLLARADAGWKNWDGVLAELQGVDWLDGIGGGEGRLLFARALEAAGRWDDAAREYTLFRSTADIATETAWAASREAQVAARAGLRVQMLAALEMTGRSSRKLAEWTLLQLVRNSLEQGDAELALQLLPMMTAEPAIAELAWDLEARAWLAAGDTSRAVGRYALLVQGRRGCWILHPTTASCASFITT